MAIPTFACFNSSQQHVSIFKLHIAVDFGTDGTGLAYAYNNEVFVHSRWSSKRFGDEVKPKTIILLDDKGNTLGFGADAKFNYISMPFHKDTWMLFERFKMALYENEMNDKNDENTDYDKKSSKKSSNKQQIDIADELIASNGMKCSADLVFIAAFKHILEEAFKFMKKKKIKDVNATEIQWIITVPAIWNDHAKYKMKQWVIKAGLIDANIKNQCKIVYEPDCASLSIQYQMHRHRLKQKKSKKLQTKNVKKNKQKYGGSANHENNKQHHNDEYKYDDKDNNDNNDEKQEEQQNISVNTINKCFKTGDKYILVDAGGGTVDVACHEILGEFGVKEILHATGGKWGSCYIDDEYFKLLSTIFSKKWMNEFKKAQPNVYIEIRHNFGLAKCTFFKKADKKWYNVRLPTDFLSFLEEKIENMDDENIQEIEDIVSNTKISGFSNLISFEDEYLEIDVMVWRSMFDHVMTPIILHIKKLLNEPKLMRNCKYLCLVGGLSCSPYFRFKMEQQFGIKSRYKLDIIIPQRPMLCVVEGAAYFGITSNYIKARVLKRTYGIKASFTESKARLNGVSKRDIEKNKIYIDYYDAYFIKNCFKVLARKNSEIQNNQIVKYSCKRQPGCKIAKIAIICSDMEYPKMANDGTVLAKLKLQFEGNNDGNNNMNIQSEFHFYDTVLKVVAYCQNTPHIKKEAQITYVSSHHT